MARSYASPSEDGSLIGAIFGTGTNGAYVEKIENIPKLKHIKGLKSMVINMEWAAFDNKVYSNQTKLTLATCHAKYPI
jgi:hexokinase